MNAALEREGPGLLLRDILRDDPQITAFAMVVRRVSPDILVLQGIDYDHGRVALRALRNKIDKDGGPHYPHVFTKRPNTGMPTGLDMDGDGRLGQSRDKQGFGRFAGQAGMAVLSRWPFDRQKMRDFSHVKWQDLPSASLPMSMDAPFPSFEAQKVQRLSSVGHWVLPVKLPHAPVLTLMTFHATPPVFDGPEDRNGHRNHDEILFWQKFLDGEFGPVPDDHFVLLGDANIDPVDGEGRKSAVNRLLADPRLQDPEPKRPGPVLQGPEQSGDPRLDTVAWPDDGPGHLRVQYLLPSSDLRVVNAGVHWPTPDTDVAAEASAAGPHRMVWVDIALPE
ncbi:endonuclease/exonuclease/phosphatase family protein [Roseovarius bejariae]|nr:endonuclease/exonuclease/phosphatase family protein [Roseovarius bejariae]